MSFAPLDPDAVRPAVDDVALMLRSRTIDRNTGEEVGAFTEATRPRAAECESLIDLAYESVSVQLPGAIDPALYGAVRQIIALKAAVLLENSFYREAAVSDSPVAMLDKLADAQLVALQTSIGYARVM